MSLSSSFDSFLMLLDKFDSFLMLLDKFITLYEVHKNAKIPCQKFSRAIDGHFVLTYKSHDFVIQTFSGIYVLGQPTIGMITSFALKYLLEEYGYRGKVFPISM